MRVRKPKDIKGGLLRAQIFRGHEELGLNAVASVHGIGLDSRDCRQMGNWLLKAAKYLEEQERVRR